MRAQLDERFGPYHLERARSGFPQPTLPSRLTSERNFARSRNGETLLAMRTVSFCDDRNCHPHPRSHAEASRGTREAFRKSLSFSYLLSFGHYRACPSSMATDVQQHSPRDVHGANEQDNSAVGYG